MKTKCILLPASIALTIWLSLTCEQSLMAQSVPGLPEPGLILYGSVTNVNSGRPLATNSMTWSFSGGGSSATVPSTIAIVNGQFFFITRVPLETRSIPGTPNLTLSPTPNTLPLTSSTTTYTRSANVSGAAATITSSSRNQLGNFTFSANDRGLMERVNLQVALPVFPETFAEWALRIFGRTDIDPNADADNDGASNGDEYGAGTDPLNDQSLFKIVGILPDPAGGISILWQSVSGKIYSLHRATNVAGVYSLLSANIPGTGSVVSFRDATATGVGPYFYQLSVQ